MHHPPAGGSQAITPTTPEQARALLRDLGAPPRLLRHVALVSEAAEALLAKLHRLGVPIDAVFVRVGVVIHDVGKALHPQELDEPGDQHEAAGGALLLSRGISERLARVCITHARWDQPHVSLEELLIALADKLWRGKRMSKLEERVIDSAAARIQKHRWDLFVALDACFEAIADEGSARLSRSLLEDEER